MTRIRHRLLVLGAAGAIGLSTILPAGATWVPIDPVPIVRNRAHEDEAPSEDKDVTTTLLWSIGGIGAGAVVMGTLYLFKRKIGGFPKNPTWVAPITIMPSRENPTDETWGAGDAAHGHSDPQGAHH